MKVRLQVKKSKDLTGFYKRKKPVQLQQIKVV